MSDKPDWQAMFYERSVLAHQLEQERDDARRELAECVEALTALSERATVVAEENERLAADFAAHERQDESVAEQYARLEEKMRLVIVERDKAESEAKAMRERYLGSLRGVGRVG